MYIYINYHHSEFAPAESKVHHNAHENVQNAPRRERTHHETEGLLPGQQDPSGDSPARPGSAEDCAGAVQEREEVGYGQRAYAEDIQVIAAHIYMYL